MDVILIWNLFDLTLPQNLFRILNRLSNIHGKPNIELRPHIVTTTWGGAPSPISPEDLEKKSFEEIKQYFIEYKPEDLFLNPRESLAQTFGGIVKKDTTRYIEFAKFLEDSDIRFVYIYHFLFGLRDDFKNNEVNMDNGLIDLCEFVISQKDDPFAKTSGDHEPDLAAAQLEVARLLEVALYSKDPYLTRDQLDRIRSILIVLAHHKDPEIEDDATTGFSPFNHSLNCVRGVAMHGIFQYSLYIVRREEKLNDGKLRRGFFEPEILEVLEEKLDFTNDPSLAVHSVFGAFIPQLDYLSPEWLKDHLFNIFPEEKEISDYWQAAWDAYIFASNVYKNVFELLIPQYQRGLNILSQPQDKKDYLGGSPNERLAQHIMFAYLSDFNRI